mmetsp:Transcript_2026/g.2867  ORF Transcript_2026/g.2867 Transcript_2026/m.2867 type:complete len:137 (+) Transcript_2026:51-461(+)
MFTESFGAKYFLEQEIWNAKYGQDKYHICQCPDCLYLPWSDGSTQDVEMVPTTSQQQFGPSAAVLVPKKIFNFQLPLFLQRSRQHPNIAPHIRPMCIHQAHINRGIRFQWIVASQYLPSIAILIWQEMKNLRKVSE